MDPRDPKVIASGVAALVVAGAVIAGIASGVDREVAAPAVPPQARTDIDSAVIGAGEIGTSEVVVPRGWRVAGSIDYATEDWETVSIDHEDRDTGTMVVIRARNHAGEPRRIAAWIHYAPPAGE